MSNFVYLYTNSDSCAPHKHNNILAINLPRKVWRTKIVNKYTIPNFNDDISDDVFDFSQYGKCMQRKQLPWIPTQRKDIIHYKTSLHLPELQRDIKIHPSCPANIASEIMRIIKKYWDCFDTAGCKRTILGFIFRVDTGDAAPICCKTHSYGFCESKIIL